MDEKPEDIEQYKKWLNENHNIEITLSLKNNYEISVERMKQQFIKSLFWKHLSTNLKEYNDEYLLDKKFQLLQGTTTPEILTKPFDSLLIKTFRKNILENDKFPEEPPNGWILPTNWYSRINDLLRMTIVVKYLDGVEFIIGKIGSLCKEIKHDFNCVFEATEVGYYAVHLYTKEEFDIPRIDWDTETVNSSIELQIITQLQEVIRTLLHKYYEERRISQPQNREMWQWDYRSDEFATNYLGHILHYVEGMIMGIRERKETQ